MSETDDTESNFDDILEELVENYQNSPVLNPDEIEKLITTFEKAEIAREKHKQVCRNYYNKHYTIKSNLSPSQNTIILQNRALRKKYYQEYHQKRKNNIEK
jgi:hypothetical protein